MTQDEKLDQLLKNQNELFTDLRVHIAKDEAQWEQVAENENDIKALAVSNGKVKTRTAVIAAVLAASGSQMLTLLKVFQ